MSCICKHLPPFSQSSLPVCVSAAFTGDTVPLREPWHLWSRGRHFSMQDFPLHKLCSWRSAKGQFSGIFPRLWGSNGDLWDSPGSPDQPGSRTNAVVIKYLQRRRSWNCKTSLSMQIPLLCAVTAPVWELRWIFNYVWPKQTVTRTFFF